MSKPISIGLIGLDTSHVSAFAKLLHDTTLPGHIPGGRIVAGFPGASEDFDASRDRVAGFTKELRDQHGVAILDNPKAVADQVDLVFITSVDGRKHRAFFEQIVDAKKPTFIDKPFTTRLSDAEAIVALAAAKNVPIMSCSSLRYADPFTAALRETDKGAIVGIDATGPMDIRPTLPGFFWYGVHAVEMVVAAMGPGCIQVRDVVTETSDLATLVWEGQRVASIRGTRGLEQRPFGVVLHRQKAQQYAAPYSGARQPYAPMLEAILRTLPNGTSDVPVAEMVECVRVMESLNQSRDNDGRPIELAAAAQ